MAKKKKVAKKTKAKTKAKPKKATVKKVTKKATKKKATKKTNAKVAKVKKVAKNNVKKAPMQEKMPVDKVAKSVKKARTKSDIMSVLAASSGVAKKEVVAIFDNLQELINLDLSKKGPGIFNFPGLMKIVKVMKPATKARKGVNPFTKEPMVFKAKPAHSVVKVRALKGLKEMAK